MNRLLIATLLAGALLIGNSALAQRAPQIPAPGAQPATPEPTQFPPAASPAQPAQSFQGPEPNVVLSDLLASVEARSGRRFVVADRRVPQEIYLGGIAVEDVDYAQLMTILSNLGFVAMEVEGRVNIVPDPLARSLPTRIVTPDAQGVPDYEVVTMIVATANVGAPQLVPLLRPLIPQSGHFVAHAESNRLIIVDRFANARRIATLIAEMDR
jgi:general secretion pathway protein D